VGGGGRGALGKLRNDYVGQRYIFIMVVGNTRFLSRVGSPRMAGKADFQVHDYPGIWMGLKV